MEKISSLPPKIHLIFLINAPQFDTPKKFAKFEDFARLSLGDICVEVTVQNLSYSAHNGTTPLWGRNCPTALNEN